jgi:hypothetical protein
LGNDSDVELGIYIQADEDLEKKKKQKQNAIRLIYSINICSLLILVGLVGYWDFGSSESAHVLRSRSLGSLHRPVSSSTQTCFHLDFYTYIYMLQSIPFPYQKCHSPNRI